MVTGLCSTIACFGSIRRFAIYYTLYIIHLFIGCTSPDKLGRLDLEAWRTDRGGCQGKRMGQMEAFREVKEDLKGMSINEVGNLLGRPDINQIIDRNQKYYIYFFEKGEHCRGVKNPSQARSVALRMSAIGVVTEVTFQRGTP